VATDMTRYSTGSEDGRRWIPWFKRFAETFGSSPDDVAQRAVAIASGAADALSGRYIPLRASLDELVLAAGRIEAERLYALQLPRLPAAPLPPEFAELMVQAEAASEQVLQLRRILRCDRRRAFAFWMNADDAAQWFAPKGAVTWIGPPRADGCVGGELSFDLRVDGTAYRVRGVYTVIDDEDRLAFDWSWQSESPLLGCCENTTVDVRFAACEEGTEVSIRHEGLPSAEARDAFIRGWIRCLDGMHALT